MDMSKYKSMFISETQEHLQSMNQGLVSIEQDPADVDSIAEVFRNAHSIKGMAASMGYDAIRDLAHAMEDLMDDIREGKTSPENDAMDLLFKGLDILEAMLQDVEQDRESNTEHQNLTNAIRTFRDEAPPPSAATPITEAGEGPEEQPPSNNGENAADPGEEKPALESEDAQKKTKVIGLDADIDFDYTAPAKKTRKTRRKAPKPDNESFDVLEAFADVTPAEPGDASPATTPVTKTTPAPGASSEIAGEPGRKSVEAAPDAPPPADQAEDISLPMPKPRKGKAGKAKSAPKFDDVDFAFEQTSADEIDRQQVNKAYCKGPTLEPAATAADLYEEMAESSRGKVADEAQEETSETAPEPASEVPAKSGESEPAGQSDTLTLRVIFSAQTASPGVRGLILFKRVGEIGEIVDSRPPAGDVKLGNFLSDPGGLLVEIDLAPEAGESEIIGVMESMTDVEHFEVVGKDAGGSSAEPGEAAAEAIAEEIAEEMEDEAGDGESAELAEEVIEEEFVEEEVIGEDEDPYALSEDLDEEFEEIIEEEVIEEEVVEEDPAAMPSAPIPPPPAADPPRPAADPPRPAAQAAESKAAPEIVKAGEPAADPFSQAPSLPQTVRVKTTALDQFINALGEMILVKGELREVAKKHPIRGLEDGLDKLDTLVRDFHDQVMSIRMMPLESVVQRLPRVVRDLARDEGKKIRFEVIGQDIELDRAILEQLSDPLIHLLRNSVNHGIESPGDRAEAGKPEEGSVVIEAYRLRDLVLLEIRDDGRGIDPFHLREIGVSKGLITREEAESMTDEAAYNLIFMPGFSTAKTVGMVSGRGVGMDAVKNVVENIGGFVSISSELGKGTTFTLHLPRTIAIVNVLLIRLAREVFAIPINKVMKTVEILPHQIRKSQDRKFYIERQELIPMRMLHRFLDLPEPEPRGREPLPALIVEMHKRKNALLVDELVGQEEAFIRPLGKPLERINGLSGVTMLGDGRVVFVLDTMSLG